MSGNTLASVGRIALTAAGYYFGGPAGGFAASIAGSLLFPGSLPDVQGPRLGPDQPLTTAAIGQAIPIFYGTIDCRGNVVQDLGRVEHEHTESAGKGAPSQESTTFTYTRTYAVLLGEGVIAGVTRIWRNAKLWYDIRPQQVGESDADFTARKAASEGVANQFALYLGTDDQMPDPVLEAAIGVGLQVAYRGRAYIVFYDEDVTDNGGRTSSWKFEVCKTGVFGTAGELEYSNEVLYPWTGEPYENTLNTNTVSGGGIGGSYSSVAAWRAAKLTATGLSFDESFGFFISSLGTGTSDQVATKYGLTYSPITEEASVQVYFNSVPNSSGLTFDKHRDPGLPGSTPDADVIDLSGVGFGERLQVRYESTALGMMTAISTGGAAPADALWELSGDGAAAPCIIGSADIYNAVHALVTIARAPSPPPNPCDGQPALPENPDYCVIGSEIRRSGPWTYIAGSFLVLAPFATSGGLVTQYPLNPALPVGHASSTETFWTDAYDAAVAAGDMPAGYTYNAAGTGGAGTYPRTQAYAYQRTITSTEGISTPPTLASIVTDICQRCTVLAADIDVGDLDETILGYRLDRIMNGRQGIEPLQSYGYFDCVDGVKLAFPTRGKAVVAELDEHTLAAHEAGQETPPLAECTISEDVELPQFLAVKYLMPHADYSVGIQHTQRQITAAVNKLYVESPIAMTDDKAKQMTEVLIGEACISRETYKLRISPRWLGLDPADAISFPLRGEVQRAVIREITGGFPGVLETQARRDDASIYLSTAAGVASGITPQQLGVAGLTIFEIIDGPAFNGAQDDAGLYVAARGTGTRWRGASLYESLDGGANYTLIASVSSASTMGAIEEALPEGPYQIWDEFNTLIVTLAAGALESRTDEAVLNGANAAFVGAAGRWELIQFRTATLLSEGRYELSGLLRGRRGTEWAIGLSADSDLFVLASTLLHVPKEDSALGMARLYKMVTSRTLIESAAAEIFTPAGVALECYAPSISASRDASGNITFNIIRRSRLGPEWIDYSDVPLNEESERYQVDVLDGVDVVRSIDTTSATPSYSAADQTADFGSAQSALDVRAYQISATVGRGYPTEATV